jgi:hypothetical protein
VIAFFFGLQYLHFYLGVVKFASDGLKKWRKKNPQSFIVRPADTRRFSTRNENIVLTTLTMPMTMYSKPGRSE